MSYHHGYGPSLQDMGVGPEDFEPEGPPKNCPRCGAFFPQRPEEGESWEIAWLDEIAGAGEEERVRYFSWDCTKCGWNFDSGSFPTGERHPIKVEPRPDPVWRGPASNDDLDDLPF